MNKNKNENKALDQLSLAAREMSLSRVRDREAIVLIG